MTIDTKFSSKRRRTDIDLIPSRMAIPATGQPSLGVGQLNLLQDSSFSPLI